MRSVIFTLVFIVSLALAAVAIQPPGARPLTAPADAFSAQRAMADDRIIAERAHPIGSADSARVRDYLVGRFRALGLDVAARPGEGIDDHSRWAAGVAAARVQNVLAVLPGRKRDAPAVTVMCHYDSVPNSPGAADDGAGVSAALEIARALKASGPHVRDVAFLITDGEEAGLLGADAFFADDPMRAHLGEVMNMETRGDAGRAAMFETAPDSGGFVDVYRRAVRRPDANSLSAAIYHRMRNGTDFTPAMAAGHAGMNFAFIGDQLAYHTPLATPDHLNRGSLQHMGEQVLSAARTLADRPDAVPAKPDKVYFDVMGLALVAYPPWFGWGLIGGSAILTLAALARLRGRRLATWGEMARGVAALPATTLASGLVLYLAGRYLGAGYAHTYKVIAHYDLLLGGAVLAALGVALSLIGAMWTGRYRLLIAVVAIAAGAACSLFGGFDPVGLGLGVATGVLGVAAVWRPSRGWGAWVGVLLAGVVVAVAIQVLLPEGGFMIEWPLLFGAASAALIPALGEVRLGSPRALWITAVVGLVVLGQIAVWGEALFEAVGGSTPPILALTVLFALPALFPLAEGAVATEPDRAASLGFTLIGVFLLALVGIVGPTARRPGLTEAFYVADFSGPQPRYLRASTLRPLDRWSRATLAADGARPARTPLPPLFPYPIWQAAARPAPVPPPQVQLARSGERVAATVAPRNGGDMLDIRLQADFPLTDATLDGRPLLAEAFSGRTGAVMFFAPPASGVRIEVKAPPHGHLEVHALESRDGWPAGLAPPPKPRSRMAWSSSDTTEAIAAANTSW